MYREELNFRWMVAGGTAAVAAVSLTGPVDAVWWRVTTVTVLVLTAELANSALEAAIDLAEPQHHPVAGYAKDATAGAVLLLAAFAVAVAVFDLWPRLGAAWRAAGGLAAWLTVLLTARPLAGGLAMLAGLAALAGLVRFGQGRGAGPAPGSEGG